jgi:hypothetical protein
VQLDLKTRMATLGLLATVLMAGAAYFAYQANVQLTAAANLRGGTSLDPGAPMSVILRLLATAAFGFVAITMLTRGRRGIEQLHSRSRDFPELQLHGRRRGMSSGLMRRFGLCRMRNQSLPQSHKKRTSGRTGRARGIALVPRQVPPLSVRANRRSSCAQPVAG